MIKRIFLLIIVFSAATQAGANTADFRVVVHPSNTIDQLDSAFLAATFLKKSTRWANDQLIRPVDQRPGARARRAFSERILRRSVFEVKTYWQQLIFSGREVPPPELDSDDDVIEFVLRNAGAIGYVSEGADTRAVKIVPVN